MGMGIETDLNYLKTRKEYINDKIYKYKQELKFIEDKLKNFTKCAFCREPYLVLRTLTTHELDLIEDSEEEMCKNDSCYRPFEEWGLYCEKCIEKRMKSEKVEI